MCDAFMIIIIVDLLLLKTHENIPVIKKKEMHERHKKTTAFQSLAVFFENKTESHFKSTKKLKNDHDNYILLSILKFDTRMNHFINKFVDKKSM